jgi:hypothetical protein
VLQKIASPVKNEEYDVIDDVPTVSITGDELDNKSNIARHPMFRSGKGLLRI